MNQPTEEVLLCIRCAQHQRTCCQTSEIYISPGDRERIAEHTGNDDFWEFRAPEDPVYGDHADDSLWMRCVFRPDGTRRVLKRQANGDCSFLGSAGCVLPLEVRPLICRLYPYDYTAEGLLPTPARGCPTQLLKPGQPLLVALQMTTAPAQRWHRQLYEEIQQEPHTDAHRADV